MTSLDAIDNGIDRYPKEVKPKYKNYSTDLASRVGRMNQAFWDDESISTDDRFHEAMKLCKADF